jgi:hypothetical protein
VEQDETLPPDGAVEYDPGDGTYTARDDWAPGVPASQRVVEVVATVTETDPVLMEPLFDAVDPDALDDLFAPTCDERVRPSTGCVTFRYEKCVVELHADGRIAVTPRADEVP